MCVFQIKDQKCNENQITLRDVGNEVVVLLLNTIKTLIDHFASSPRERENRYRRDSRRERQTDADRILFKLVNKTGNNFPGKLQNISSASFSILVNPCPTEPGYTLPLQTV